MLCVSLNDQKNILISSSGEFLFRAKWKCILVQCQKIFQRHEIKCIVKANIVAFVCKMNILSLIQTVA